MKETLMHITASPQLEARWLNNVSIMLPRKPIKPSDCRFAFSRRRVEMTLPRPIALGNAPFDSAPNFHDHDHYRNQHGDFQVGCPYVAFFVPSLPALPERDDCRQLGYEEREKWHFMFRSCHPGYGLRYTEFEFADLGQSAITLFSSSETSEDVLQRMTDSHPRMHAFAGQFLDWVNEFEVTTTVNPK